MQVLEVIGALWAGRQEPPSGMSPRQWEVAVLAFALILFVCGAFLLYWCLILVLHFLRDLAS
ncbi:MAG TPA: hypothetical protein VK395_20185 [Gemmataceae bacterium]|nr:hypothetical protein [Gemmataceae bacterium]